MSCTHTNRSEFEPFDLQGEAVHLVRCYDCNLVGIKYRDGEVRWSGEVPGEASRTREADFKLALQRLKDAELFFALIAERWNIQTAMLLESILKHVRILADSDFEGLVTVTGLAMQLADRAKRDQNLEIITSLVEQLSGARPSSPPSRWSEPDPPPCPSSTTPTASASGWPDALK